jgi:Na+/melibiose symporter-like transporter
MRGIIQRTYLVDTCFAKLMNNNELNRRVISLLHHMRRSYLVLLCIIFYFCIQHVITNTVAAVAQKNGQHQYQCGITSTYISVAVLTIYITIRIHDNVPPQSRITNKREAVYYQFLYAKHNKTTTKTRK